MFFLIKFTLSFVVSFLILSIPVGEKTIFQTLSSVTSPYTQKVFKIVGRNSAEIVGVTKEATHKIFSNSKPEIVDRIKEKSSSVEKNAREEIRELQIDSKEEYTVEERQLLEQVLKNASVD